MITAGLVMVGNADENGGFDAAHTTYELDQVLPYDAASFTAEVAFQAASEVLLATMRVTSSASDAFETIRTLAHFSNDANGQTESVPLTAHLPDHDLVAIRVLTKDGRTTRTYTVRVARAAPPGPPPPPAAPPPPAPPSPPPVDLFPEIAPLSPADSPECTHCAPGTFSAARDVLACAPCAPGSGGGAASHALRRVRGRLLRQARGGGGVLGVSPGDVRRERRVGDVRFVRGGHHERGLRRCGVRRRGRGDG